WWPLEKRNKSGLFWWTHKGSNLGPLQCEGNALPLSYASGIFVRDQKPASGRSIGKYMSLVTAIYEVRATGVKLIAKTHAEASAWLLLPGAGGVGLLRPDPFGKRPAAACGRGTARFRANGRSAIGRSRRHRRDRGFRRQHGLDRRIRPLELHRELCDFGGDIVDAFAQQRIFHALGRP